KALADYRRAYETRHKILEGFMPFWRSLDKTMAQVDKKLTGLQSSTAAVDAHMEKFEQINAKTDKAEHALTVSAFTQFAIAFLVMAVASGGAFVNFKLIALPMSEMVGAGDYISSSLRTSEVAALVIIFVEASMGLFLMESLRITHLFLDPCQGHEKGQPERAHATPHDVDRADPSRDPGRDRGGARADARHADLRQAGAAALPGDGATGRHRRLGRPHPDGRPDAARLHPAVRARLYRDPARIAHLFDAYGRRGAAGGVRADAGVRAAHP